ncbi:hypothetical protein OQJ18_08990 [Fluoribacter dumoffii]|uniref:Uncharacterized protein n=1 Tax=Fluoribacter dumoffii TaxID=463 RepID=A0A377G7Z6_9GAMM|nr:hypothetical protein [Fluoribacter dumoffii]KTC89512.1 hypothetical protein Ldum_0580 [Fluoribacter dumoffii NY 23]MCW8384703.1 hypothetical protein [Fluoribacter dumoffii]MCW8417767.1 hypothetical protein [Fluoribacter dumoffii]MCW8454391.1 hypothetical protein [Fluoribacter dumoffii]MCW8461535.1 hypothetical protein [Fluoribacter dumoffii]
MNRISFNMVAGVVSCFLLSSAFADTPAVQTSKSEISGTYLCDFHDPFSGSPNGRELLIIKKISDNNYRMFKKGLHDATPTIVGVGLQNKEQNNALSFLFWWSKDMTTTFTQSIIVKTDGTLDGRWVQNNKDKAATFSCKKSS